MIELCGEQMRKAIAERRGTDYGRAPANWFYVTCQREAGHEGDHVGQWFGSQVRWEAARKPEPGELHWEGEQVVETKGELRRCAQHGPFRVTEQRITCPYCDSPGTGVDEKQWQIGIRTMGGNWVVIGWTDLVERLKEMELGDALIQALRGTKE